MRTVLVTGAAGFVGQHLCRFLVAQDYRVIGVLRRSPKGSSRGICYHAVGDIAAVRDWSSLLVGVDAVVHLAACVHVAKQTDFYTASSFHRINVAASEMLARQAAATGVRRFLFVSSIKASPEFLSREGALDHYAHSKAEAEISLRQVSKNTGLELVILRPPLIYGPGQKGNLARLQGLLRRRVPLPIGSVRNRRSFLYVGNLVHAIDLCLRHPAAPGGTFELSDGQPLSTPAFVAAMAKAYGVPVCLWPCPLPLLNLLGRTMRQSATIERLTGDLVADDRLIRDRLGWRPPFNTASGLSATVTFQFG